MHMDLRWEEHIVKKINILMKSDMSGTYKTLVK